MRFWYRAPRTKRQTHGVAKFAQSLVLGPLLSAELGSVRKKALGKTLPADGRRLLAGQKYRLN